MLFFWPLDFTFVCPTEICQFNDRKADFDAIDCQLIGCSVDSHFVHREYTFKSRDKGGLGPMDVPMVSDLNKTIARDYGCLLDHSDDAGVALRATYIIDKEGILRQFSINDLPVGRNVDEVLRLVKAFQYTDVHGDVCPSGWNPGDQTMVADHNSDKLAAFWANVHGAQK